jgi:hypothetical protein
MACSPIDISLALITYKFLLRSMLTSPYPAWVVCSFALLDRPWVLQLKKFQVFGAWRFVTEFTRAIQWSLYWTNLIQSIPSHIISGRSILIFFTYLRLGLLTGIFPSGLPANNICAFILSWSARPIPFDLIFVITLGEGYKSQSSSLCNFLRPCVTLYPLGPNILLSTLFSNALRLCSSLNVRDNVSHPHRTCKTIVFTF